MMEYARMVLLCCRSRHLSSKGRLMHWGVTRKLPSRRMRSSSSPKLPEVASEPEAGEFVGIAFSARTGLLLGGRAVVLLHGDLAQ